MPCPDAEPAMTWVDLAVVNTFKLIQLGQKKRLKHHSRGERTNLGKSSAKSMQESNYSNSPSKSVEPASSLC